MTRTFPSASLFSALLVLACSGCSLLDGDTAGDDTDADTDTDTDSDTDECLPLEPDPVPGPDCLSGTLTCGASVTATTVGGSDVLDQVFYQEAFCFVPYDSYTGAERVYAFVLPADRVATITLHSPCADLDLVVVRWEDEDDCPRAGSIAGACDGDASEGDGVVDDLWSDRDARHLVIVDGKNGVEDNFTLSVACTGR